MNWEFIVEYLPLYEKSDSSHSQNRTAWNCFRNSCQICLCNGAIPQDSGGKTDRSSIY